MDEYRLNPADDDLEMEAPETPEDVAVLYTWANVHGGKYRDFSASRREYRAQQRHRMVEAQREAELDAARAREEAAAREMEEVRRLEEQARHDEHMRAEAEEARRRAEENIEQERLAAQRHVEVAEELKRALDEAQREMEDARRRAEEQAARYAEADARYRASARQQEIPGEIVDPYYYAGPLEPTAFAPGKGVRSSVPQRVSSEKRIVDDYYRSKGSSEVMAAARVDDSSYGLFSDGQRPRQSSAGRRAYTEVSPSEVLREGAPTQFTEPRPELPEEARERHRADELDRLSDHQSAHAFDDNEDDGYYDRTPVRQDRSSDPSARNSAANNVFLQPRVQQVLPSRSRSEELQIREDALHAREEAMRAREEASRHEEELQRQRVEAARQREDDRLREEARLREESRLREEARVREEARARDSRHREEPVRHREDSREREVIVPSEDPTPGNVHRLDDSRVRRRESAADVHARTARRPRESGVMPVAGDSRDAVRHAEPKERVQRPSAAVEREPHRANMPVVERRPEPEQRPEWLLRDARRPAASEPVRRTDLPPMRDDAPSRPLEHHHHEERRHRGESQMIPAADGGFNLKPLPDVLPSPVSQREAQPLPVRTEQPRVPVVPVVESPRGESTPQITAAPPVQERPARISSPSIPAATGDPVPHRVQAERRRSERNSGDRLTRELRVPTAPAEPEPRERRLAAESDATASRAAGPHPADTLQQSRERVAARWYALKGLMGGESSAEVPVARSSTREMPVPILSVVSLSGGVGKTSLVAAVGRALSSVGERVLLADATPHGLLPYYFGSRELRPDVVRTFSPPPGSKDAPVYMVNYEADRLNGDEAGQSALLEEIGRHTKGTQRVLLDLNGTSAWLARRLAGINSTILVPVAPDMNSVLGIKGVERYFAGLQDADGRPQLPYYILNQFDASLPLHLDVREVLRQQLGDRLLPVMIRRSPSVAEALAEGMTVMDYAPESPVTEDYAQLAEWVRKRFAPAQATTMRSTRWSER